MPGSSFCRVKIRPFCDVPVFALTFWPERDVTTRMSIEQDLAKIALQEQTLRFVQFDEHTAWEIGSRLRAAAEKRGAAVAVDITLGGFSVFSCVLPGASPNNANWVRRKRNTVLHFHRSSYGFGLQLDHEKTDFTAKFGLPLSDYAVHGGSFPIRVNAIGVVGAITVSGLPQREDHEIIISVLADFLKQPLAAVCLD
jgi:uncharacterized protein (UPF0303 family)